MTSEWYSTPLLALPLDQVSLEADAFGKDLITVNNVNIILADLQTVAKTQAGPQRIKGEATPGLLPYMSVSQSLATLLSGQISHKLSLMQQDIFSWVLQHK